MLKKEKRAALWPRRGKVAYLVRHKYLCAAKAKGPGKPGPLHP
jgi:hypothetical protein